MLLYRIAILAFGVFACSTAVIMIKLTDLHPVLLAGYRLLVASLVLGPLWARARRRYRGQYGAGDLKRSLLPGILLGLHFISWIVGARMTLAANASLIVNMVPVAMPFLSYFLVRELINRGEVAGTLLVLVGVACLGAADYHVSLETFTGDVICFCSMLLFAGYLALARKNRGVPDLWLYIVPVYAVAGLFCLLVSFFFVNPVQVYSQKDVLLIVGLAVVPTVIGHSSLQYSMKHLRVQVAAIGTLGQFVFAGTLAFIILGEVPGWAFYLAASLLVAGATIAIRATPSTP